MSRRAAGFTLVEIVIAIVVMAIAVAGVMTVFVNSVRYSADPMVRQQAIFIAEAYLEEILRQSFHDPDLGVVCSNTNSGETRSTFDNVCDYQQANLPDTKVRNQSNAQIGALAAYSVSVAVVSTGVALGSIDNVGAIRVLRVDVTVNGPGGTSITLSGYRTNYNCDAATDVGCKSL